MTAVARETNWLNGADVELDELALGPQLGEGGQGKVFRVSSSRIPVVYKQYRASQPDGTALQALVRLPTELPSADRELLFRYTAWPLARVMRRGDLTGFLMPEIPEKFFGRNSAGTLRQRELQFLVYEPKPAWGEIVPAGVGIRTRLSIATQCARLVALLHSHSLVVGDISMLNILWVPGLQPEIYFIDCDGIRKRGWRPVLQQAETIDWEDPSQPKIGPDRDSDRYKLALLIGRVLCRRPYLRPTQEIGPLPNISYAAAAELRSLWIRASRPHGKRPDAREWLNALTEADLVPELPR